MIQSFDNGLQTKSAKILGQLLLLQHCTGASAAPEHCTFFWLMDWHRSWSYTYDLGTSFV